MFRIKMSIVKLAILSRLQIILLQFIANSIVPDHNANVFVAPADPRQSTGFIEFTLGGFRRWDAQYFLHISEHGYTFENSLAFYPLYPFIVRLFVTLFTKLMPWITFREAALLLGICVNVIFFLLATKSLYRLSNLVLRNKNKSNIAVLLFCINPASIFFTAPYTESLFAWLSFWLMQKCFQHKLMDALIPLILSILCRSNGIINIGFVLFFGVQEIYLKFHSKSFNEINKLALRMIFVLAIALAIFAAIPTYHYYLFCTKNRFDHSDLIKNYAAANNFILSGNSSAAQSPWCLNNIPLAYSYVQSHYWNVGFLRYYTFKQIPNFLLALPIIYLFVKNTLRYFAFFLPELIRTVSVNKSLNLIFKSKHFVFMVHAAVMTCVCISFVHIQVSTRILASSSPCLYWFNSLPVIEKNNLFKPKKYFLCLKRSNKMLVLWFLSYYCIGTIMFCNFLPWT